MPITANAVAISAQEVLTFKASPPSLLQRRLNRCPIYFLLFLRIATRFRSLCAHDQIGGQPPLYIALEIPDEIVLSLFVAAPDEQYPFQAYLSLSI
jgi:hypothetical protein